MFNKKKVTDYIKSLPEVDQKILVLKINEKLSLEEISFCLEIPIEIIFSKLFIINLDLGSSDFIENRHI